MRNDFESRIRNLPVADEYGKDGGWLATKGGERVLGEISRFDADTVFV